MVRRFNGLALKHLELKIILIRGNHDKRAGDPPTALAFEAIAKPLLLGPFTGGTDIKSDVNGRFFVVGDGAVWRGC